MQVHAGDALRRRREPATYGKAIMALVPTNTATRTAQKHAEPGGRRMMQGRPPPPIPAQQLCGCFQAGPSAAGRPTDGETELYSFSAEYLAQFFNLVGNCFSRVSRAASSQSFTQNLDSFGNTYTFVIVFGRSHHRPSVVRRSLLTAIIIRTTKKLWCVVVLLKSTRFVCVCPCCSLC